MLIASFGRDHYQSLQRDSTACMNDREYRSSTHVNEADRLSLASREEAIDCRHRRAPRTHLGKSHVFLGFEIVNHATPCLAAG